MQPDCGNSGCQKITECRPQSPRFPKIRNGHRDYDGISEELSLRLSKRTLRIHAADQVGRPATHVNLHSQKNFYRRIYQHLGPAS